MRFVKNIMVASLASIAFMVSSAQAASHHLARVSHTRNHAHHVPSANRVRHTAVAKPASVAASVPVTASASVHRQPLLPAHTKLTS